MMFLWLETSSQSILSSAVPKSRFAQWGKGKSTPRTTMLDS